MRTMDLLELLGERHSQLRRLAEERWAAHSDIEISNSEWLILAKIGEGEPTIAYVAKQVGITRQATHKLIKKMVAKELVEVNDAEDNKKVKRVRLSRLGKQCFEENNRLKAGLEQELEGVIGAGQVERLKTILSMDWNVEKPGTGE